MCVNSVSCYGHLSALALMFVSGEAESAVYSSPNYIPGVLVLTVLA